MPLPAALQARLLKRGILRSDAQEEIIAEDYSDDISDVLTFEISLCPNRDNKFHECSSYCRKRYGFKKFRQIEALEEKRAELLRRYPLSDKWKEVGDPMTGRYYYWNAETNEVSWLPPKHPRSKITKSDASLSRRAGDQSKEKSGEKRKKVSIIEAAPQMNVPEEIPLPEAGTSKKTKYMPPSKGLDPMDPASYGDCEPGDWSTGLNTGVVSGADATASGPLFQQRPYPSPGDILRANAAAKS